MEKVSIVKCNTYENKKVRKALLDSLKNINFKFKKGSRVLIKPNLIAPQKKEKAVTTHPVIVEELCKILKEHKCKIFIGESAAFNTDQAFKTCGISKLSKYAKIINFEGDKKKFVTLDGVKKVPLAKSIFDVDLVINFPKLKTHCLMQTTLCVKNLYGCIPGNLKAIYHKTMLNNTKFGKFLLKIEEKINPQLNIIDGILALEGNGPGASGKPIKANVIIAGKNARATDIIASEFMGFKYKQVITNKLSKIPRKDIEVVGSGKNKRMMFLKPQTFYSPLAHWMAGLLAKHKIEFDYDKCTKCGTCERQCPVHAIKLNPWPKCNHKKCILCLCCIEVCPEKAISLKEHFIVKTIRKLFKT